MRRQTGRTTRLADKAIQDLFINGEIIVQDHYGTLEANKELAKIITNRLTTEHHGVFEQSFKYGQIFITLID